MPTNLIMENRDWQQASDIQGADQKVKSSFVLKVAPFVFSSLFIFSGLVVSYKAITEKPMDIGGIVLGFVHMGLGLTIGFITRYIKKKLNIDRLLKSKYPDQPWMWSEEWAKGYSSPIEIKYNIVSILFGLIFFAITFPAAYVAVTKAAANPYEAPLYAVLLFPLAGFLIFLSSLKQFLKNRSLGQARFTFSECGVLGGKLVGQIKLNCQISERTPILIRLNSKHSIASNNSRNFGANQSRILWQNELIVHAHNSGPFSAINIGFDIPYDAALDLESQNLSKNILSKSRRGRYHWDLIVEIQDKDRPLKLSYNVPVFKTAKSDHAKVQALESQEPLAREKSNISQDHKCSSYDLLQKPQGLEISFSKKNIFKASFAFSGVGFIFCGAGLFLFKKISSDTFSIVDGVFGLAFFLMGVILLGVGIMMALQKVRITISNHDLTILKSFAFFKSSTLILLSEISDVSLSLGMQQGDKVWYDIKVDRNNSPSIKIPAAITKKSDALWIMQIIEQKRSKIRGLG